jgi:NAD-dependent dihydropyrimidine dehydrogenase PreA subunit
MYRLKRAIDPSGLLNPDVILTSKPKLHLENIKDLPIVEDVVDKCVECGACEPRCPSRDFTLSPRQRIVLRRARQRLIAQGRTELAKQLDRDYEFAGKQSCATDGLCALDCPVAINTGDLIKQLRRESNSPSGNQRRVSPRKELWNRRADGVRKLARGARRRWAFRRQHDARHHASLTFRVSRVSTVACRPG